MDEASDEAALAALLVRTATTMMTMTTIPATDIPIDACPSFLALSVSSTAVLLATTAHTSSTYDTPSAVTLVLLLYYYYY